jgi:hypothetical protein
MTQKTVQANKPTKMGGYQKHTRATKRTPYGQSYSEQKT